MSSTYSQTPAQRYPKSSYSPDFVDFKLLASQDEDFKRVFKAKGGFDFHNAEHVQQLTKSLLRRDFDLKLELPSDRLCPPVPVRYAYVKWIQSLIDTTSPTLNDDYSPSRNVIGLDIGTGASAIYALLALRCRPSWRMAGTEIDAKSAEFARLNIERNDFQSRFRLHISPNTNGPLVPLDELGLNKVEFTICNPPFFSSEREMHASMTGEGKLAPPSATCTGAETEMVCAGGDTGFVLRIVEESLKLQGRVGWYSSMLGKLSSLEEVVARLQGLGVTNWAVTVLSGGGSGAGKTRRWAVAWSFGDYRPLNDVCRAEGVEKSLLPFPPSSTIPIRAGRTNDAMRTLNETLEGLNLQWRWKQELRIGVGMASGNVWSRAARRRKMRQERELMDEDEDDSDEELTVALAFKITVTDEAVEVRWLRGRDHVFFESFCGMVKRVVDGA